MREELKFIATALIYSGPMFIIQGGDEYGLGLIVAGAFIHGYLRIVDWVASAFDVGPK